MKNEKYQIKKFFQATGIFLIMMIVGCAIVLGIKLLFYFAKPLFWMFWGAFILYTIYHIREEIL